MTKMRLLLLLVFFLWTPSMAQSPYSFSWRKELPLILTTVTVNIGSVWMDQQVSPLSLGEIENLNPLSVNSFDRPAVRHSSFEAKQLSDQLLYSSLMAPLALGLRKPVRNEVWGVGLMYLEVLGLTGGITGMTKKGSLRIRPYVYNSEVSLRLKLMPKARFSFFSGHTSLTAASAFFVAKVFHDYHPGSHLRVPVWILAAALPALTGYARVRAGRHYYTDVISGYAIGAFVGVMVPQIHRRSSKISLSFSPMRNSQSLQMLITF